MFVDRLPPLLSPPFPPSLPSLPPALTSACISSNPASSLRWAQTCVREEIPSITWGGREGGREGGLEVVKLECRRGGEEGGREGRGERSLPTWP